MASTTFAGPLKHITWENGKMIDLGTLGGTWGGVYGLNNLGQLVGYSNLAGDQTAAPFLWDRGVLPNLGSLGGGWGTATSINNAGDVVGASWTESGTYDPFLWSHGVMTDLGLLVGEAWGSPLGINASRQVVGETTNYTETTAFLWENGGPVVDLNALVDPCSNPSNTQFWGGVAVADSGEIIALRTLPNGDTRMGVLVPDGICGSDCASTTVPVCTVSGDMVTLVRTGKCSITAGQAGDEFYYAAAPVSQSFRVTSGSEPQTITFPPLPNEPYGTPPITLSASASSDLPVSFGSTTSATCTVSGDQVALVMTGRCAIKATQPGNATFAPATPVIQAFTITKAAQNITFGALSNQPINAAPFTVSAMASSGLPREFFVHDHHDTHRFR
jgi:probable HAF family extracellular repeat protein